MAGGRTEMIPTQSLRLRSRILQPCGKRLWLMTDFWPTRLRSTLDLVTMMRGFWTMHNRKRTRQSRLHKRQSNTGHSLPPMIPLNMCLPEHSNGAWHQGKPNICHRDRSSQNSLNLASRRRPRASLFRRVISRPTYRSNPDARRSPRQLKASQTRRREAITHHMTFLKTSPNRDGGQPIIRQAHPQFNHSNRPQERQASHLLL